MVPYLVLYVMVPSARVRLFMLLLFCALFHAHFAGPSGVLPIIVLATITYLCARSGSRLAIKGAIVVCVLALAFYKYAFFISVEVIGAVFSGQGKALSDYAASTLPALPPLAISFFTFEFVHYLYEVLKGGKPITSPFRFAAFAIFFPSLVAGPIKRYQQFLPSLESGLHNTDLRRCASGLVLVAVGFFKKLVIADNCTRFTEAYRDQFVELDPAMRWLFLVLLSFRIYMDFAGYSDIAIGLARIMGVDLPANFNWPYLACNIKDFWQRWHMSLSSWIRDYVYIPLGGNRGGLAKTILNAGIAFALCGLWHGPHWNFVVWGLYHGLGFGICLGYRHLGFVGARLYRLLQAVPFLGWLITYLFVAFGWLIFFYPPEEALFKMVLLFKGASL